MGRSRPNSRQSSRPVSQPSSHPGSRPTSRPSTRPTSPGPDAPVLDKFRELSEELTQLLSRELVGEGSSIEENSAIKEILKNQGIIAAGLYDFTQEVIEDFRTVKEGIARVRKDVETTNRRITRVEGKIDRCLWFIERIAEKKGISTK